MLYGFFNQKKCRYKASIHLCQYSLPLPASPHLLYPQKKISCSIISCAFFWVNSGSGDIMWHHMTSCDVIWRHVTSCDVIWRHMMSYDVTCHYMLFFFPKKGSNDNVKTRWQSTIAMILVLLVLLLLNNYRHTIKQNTIHMHTYYTFLLLHTLNC